MTLFGSMEGYFMARKPFKKPPLIEVIVEVRWKLKEGTHPDTKIDPHYKLLPGKFSDNMIGPYPYHEELPQASIPDEISPYMVKHRFRHQKDEWPLVQLGPGILTVNHTKKYTTFDEFKPLAISAVDVLFKVYPEPADLKIQSIVFRCIDAILIDYQRENVMQFLKEKMGIQISLPEKLFTDTSVERIPQTFFWQTSFICNKPKGLGTIRFALGKSSGNPALIWEQIVGSEDSDVPLMPQGFEQWIDEAHTLTESWFLGLIQGSLEKEFENA